MPKRKEPSSSSTAVMAVTFTRSRSEILLHRTRSGRARPDPPKRRLPPSSSSARTISNSSSAAGVKDLRLKRVFSDRTATVAPGSGKPTAEIQDPAVSSGSVDDLVGSNNSGKDSEERTVAHSNSRMEVDRVEEMKSLDLDSTTRSSIRSGLSRCSRSKLIGNQRSFSYKRLLPYLKDLVKGDSYGTEVLHPNNQPIKAEKTTEHNMPLLNADPLSNQQNHAVPLEDLSTTFSGQIQELERNLKSTSQVDIPQTTIIGSPDVYNERNSQAQQVTCKMAVTNNEMASINTLEKETCRNFEEHHNVDPREDVPQTTTVESPDSYNKDKLEVHKTTSKKCANDEEMDDINKLEKEETSENMNGGTMDILIGCDHDNVQGTPPDVDLVSKLDNAEGGKRSNLLKPDLCNTSKKRLGPVSRSRSKLFRNPSSFSYRRLLPYIMDLAKDGSSDMTILHPKNYSTTIEKNIQEIPHISNIDPSSKVQHQTIPSGDNPSTTSVVNQQSEENPYSERHGLSFHEHNCSPVTLVPFNSLDESKLQIYECKSELPQERSETEYEMIYRLSSSPAIGEDLPVQELTGNVQEPLYSPLKMDKKPLKGVSQFESCDHGSNQPLASRKGILRKQSRGCKGICMCLDCASFRVHAERAFEFSRKQMLEADEVAEGLMKELSCLRNLLERILMPVADRRGTYTSLQLNQEQVTGVCQRALGVEEAAKGRMREMILDLNTHCKIPGPRVSFSEYVGKQNIP